MDKTVLVLDNRRGKEKENGSANASPFIGGRKHWRGNKKGKKMAMP